MDALGLIEVLVDLLVIVQENFILSFGGPFHVEVNGIATESSSETAIDKDGALKTLISAFGGGRISFASFIQKISSHKIDIVGSFVIEYIFMGTCPLSGC